MWLLRNMLLRNVVAAEYVMFYKINKFFVRTVYYFFIIDKMASRATSGPRAVVWRPLT